MSGTRTRATARSTRKGIKKKPAEEYAFLFFKGTFFSHTFLVKGTSTALHRLDNWARKNRLYVRAQSDTWGNYMNFIRPITTLQARQKIRDVIAAKDNHQKEMWLTSS